MADTDQAQMSMNQLVAYNLERARRERGMSQEELGAQLFIRTRTKWSKATVSAAVRSAHSTERIRKFDANEIAAFALIFELPIAYFFTPPEDGELPGAWCCTDRQDALLLGHDSPRVTTPKLADVLSTPRPTNYEPRMTRLMDRLQVNWTPAQRSNRVPIPWEIQEELDRLAEANGGVFSPQDVSDLLLRMAERNDGGDSQ